MEGTAVMGVKNVKIAKTRITAAATLVITVAVLVFSIVSFYPLKYSDIVKEQSELYGLDESLIYAVIKTESGYNKNALSYKGAKGLMQIMDTTGEWGFLELGINTEFSPEKLFDPQINIEIGCWYLNKLINQYDNTDTALAAYNAGSGNVSRWLKNPDYFDGESLYNIPFNETRNYVKKVNRNKKIYELLRGVA